MQVDLGKPCHDKIEPVCLFQLLNLFLKFKTLENFTDIFRETRDVVGEMTSDVIGVALEPLEVQLTVIMEAKILAATRNLVQDPVEIAYLPILPRVPTFYHCFFRRLQHTIEPPQHGHG